jgi:hypothetical protein
LESWGTGLRTGRNRRKMDILNPNEACPRLNLEEHPVMPTAATSTGTWELHLVPLPCCAWGVAVVDCTCATTPEWNLHYH